MIAVLVAGVVLAVIRQPDGPGRAQPSPTAPPTTEPTDGPTMEPTDGPTPEPTDGPTTEPTDGPTTEPTDGPTPEPTDGPPDDDGVVGGVPPGGAPLAETGGPVVPWLLAGSLLMGMAAALWRLSRAG